MTDWSYILQKKFLLVGAHPMCGPWPRADTRVRPYGRCLSRHQALPQETDKFPDVFMNNLIRCLV